MQRSNKNLIFWVEFQKTVKFEFAKNLDDGSYLSWIAPDGQSKKKGATRIQVRVIEYVIAQEVTKKVYRLTTNLMHTTTFLALLLAQEYHQGWEIENTLDELKVHLNGRKTLIRSKNPREVIQENYGWLLGHFCIRAIMFKSATESGIFRLSLSFTGSIRVVRRAITQGYFILKCHVLCLWANCYKMGICEA